MIYLGLFFGRLVFFYLRLHDISLRYLYHRDFLLCVCFFLSGEEKHCIRLLNRYKVTAGWEDKLHNVVILYFTRRSLLSLIPVSRHFSFFLPLFPAYFCFLFLFFQFRCKLYFAFSFFSRRKLLSSFSHC